MRPRLKVEVDAVERRARLRLDVLDERCERARNLWRIGARGGHPARIAQRLIRLRCAQHQLYAEAARARGAERVGTQRDRAAADVGGVDVERRVRAEHELAVDDHIGDAVGRELGGGERERRCVVAAVARKPPEGGAPRGGKGAEQACEEVSRVIWQALFTAGEKTEVGSLRGTQSARWVEGLAEGLVEGQAAAPAAAAVAAEVWELKDGGLAGEYYVNKLDGRTSWERPPPATASPVVDAAGGGGSPASMRAHRPAPQRPPNVEATLGRIHARVQALRLRAHALCAARVELDVVRGGAPAPAAASAAEAEAAEAAAAAEAA